MEEWVNNSLEVYLKGSLFMSCVVSFLGGVLASFTPCVYPMIPITAGFVGGKNVGGSRLKGFALSTVYVSGMAVTYAALGMVAALTGRFFGEINTNPWIYFAVANVIILFGLGMLEVFEIPMLGPGSSTGAGGFIGVFAMGIVSGFVTGPCTAPVLGVLLTYVATTRDAIMGATLLLSFAFGMGMLLIAVGTFSGLVSALPRSGVWMVKVKKAMGFVMILMGEYFLIKMGQLML